MQNIMVPQNDVYVESVLSLKLEETWTLIMILLTALLSSEIQEQCSFRWPFFNLGNCALESVHLVVFLLTCLFATVNTV